jgi:hypothetical protein
MIIARTGNLNISVVSFDEQHRRLLHSSALIWDRRDTGFDDATNHRPASADFLITQAKAFLIAFFEVFGITDKRFASFEHAVKKHGGGQGFVDAFWPGILLIEMKSRGKNLDRAYTQAIDYFPGLKERDLPRYVLVCDFARFRLHDLSEGTTAEFALADFHKNVRLFGFVAGYQTQVIKPQDPINIRAAERMGRLHDQMKAVGYVGRPLEIYLVRLLFCLFSRGHRHLREAPVPGLPRTAHRRGRQRSGRPAGDAVPCPQYAGRQAALQS